MRRSVLALAKGWSSGLRTRPRVRRDECVGRKKLTSMLRSGCRLLRADGRGAVSFADSACKPKSAHRFDLAAAQTDVGERAIVELLERPNIAAAAPFGHELARQPGAALGEDLQARREPARRGAR